MGVLSRLSNLVTANLHALLDRAENLEVLLDQAVRDLEAGLSRARQATAVAIAAERRLQREADRHRSLATEWRDRAREALAAGNETLARQALDRWHEHDVTSTDLDAEHAEAAQACESARSALRGLESRLSEARRRERLLLVRHRTAQVRLTVQRQLDAGDADAVHGRLLGLEERLGRRTDEWIAEAELCDVGRIETEFLDRDRQQAIDRELEALSRERTATSE
jgi:phage shock protein A